MYSAKAPPIKPVVKRKSSEILLLPFIAFLLSINVIIIAKMLIKAKYINISLIIFRFEFF